MRAFLDGELRDLGPQELPLCPFTGLDSIFLVVRRKPISALKWYQRALIRFAYFRTGWASDYSVEYEGVYTDKSEAEQVAMKDGWSFTEIPLNASLPEETCVFRCHDFPKSEARARYQNRKLSVVATPLSNIVALQESIANLKKVAAG